MNKILDYEEMINYLDNIKGSIIEEKESIGSTEYGYPIRHYTYGHGDNHVIITAGTHAVELITNHFVLKLMNELAYGNIKINPDEYTIHFLPILNPEGTIIVTSALRTLITRDINPRDEQYFCVQYYLNGRLEDKYAVEKNDHDLKLQNWMFRYADINCISEEHLKLKENIAKIIKQSDLPKGCLIGWGSNGNGIDLNANIETGEYLNKFMNGEEMYAGLRQNTIKKNNPGPIGCPSKNKTFELEKENQAILNFYAQLIKDHQVIGSIIYHSCGGIVYYLDEMTEINPWLPGYGIKEIEMNRRVAAKYAEITGYKLDMPKTYTTMDAKLKTFLPGTILVELSKVGPNPLAQFIDVKDNLYTNMIEDNLAAINPTIEEMKKQYQIMKEQKYHILVNKDHEFKNEADYKIIKCESRYSDSIFLEEKTYQKWLEFKQFALANGYDIDIESGYRSLELQKQVFAEVKAEYGLEHTLKFVAKPGFSEHQTGLAVDLCLKEGDNFLVDFEIKNQEFLKFVQNNIAKFGFVIRYPLGKEEITKYGYEPWHLRYVGIDFAKYLDDNKLTLEEYYSLNKIEGGIKNGSQN